MNLSEVERFARDLKTDAGLLAAARKLAARPASDVVALAADHGYRFTVDDARSLIKARAEVDGGQLSDEDLDAVTYGRSCANPICICLGRSDR